MGFSITQQDNDIVYNLKEFICDNVSDIDILPTKCAPGSKALCLEDANVYVLNTDHKWVLLDGSKSSLPGGGGSGSGSGGNAGEDEENEQIYIYDGGEELLH